MTWRPYPRRSRLATGVALAALVAAAGRHRLLRVEVAGDSMRPTLEPGDRLVALAGLRPRAGDVVAVTAPREARVLVKRVATVGPEGLDVRGDDPAASTDSRAFGPLDRGHVLGRVVWRYAPAGRTGPVPRGHPPETAATLPDVDDDGLDRLLADGADVTGLTMEELRRRRAELQAVEVALSYRRRVAQGRLDIVAAEQRRRRGEDAEGASLVEQLPGILADRITAPGTARLPRLMTPDAEEVDTGELDAIVGPARLGALGDLDDGALEALVERLGSYEAGVSTRRRSLHDRIDALQAEITRRYRTGEASVESLLR
jgi:nickel-type superoxide dismutase maturation protease